MSRRLRKLIERWGALGGALAVLIFYGALVADMSSMGTSIAHAEGERAKIESRQDSLETDMRAHTAATVASTSRLEVLITRLEVTVKYLEARLPPTGARRDTDTRSPSGPASHPPSPDSIDRSIDP